MNEIFSHKYSLRTSDFDRYNRILPSSVLDLFQTAAGAHAKLLGCGYDALIERSLMWVLIRVRYKILKEIPLFSSVTVKTWPLSPSRLSFAREYEILDENGDTAIIGSSDWVLMNAETRRLVPAEDVYNLEHYNDVKLFENRATKLASFESDTPEHTVLPLFSQIDMNGHVNNTKYLNYVLDASPLSDKERIESVQIDYRHEVLEGNTLKIKALRKENTLCACGQDSDGNTMFACEIQLS